MKTISTLALLLFSFITFGQTTKTKKDVEIEEVPHKNIELINSDGTLISSLDTAQVPLYTENETKIYSKKDLEVYPEFPGGKERLALFLSKNIRLTDEMKKNKVKGIVNVLLIIEKDGSITDIKAARGLGFGAEAEALRVVKGMPKWKPGILNGKNVRSTFVLPINIDATKQ